MYVFRSASTKQNKTKKYMFYPLSRLTLYRKGFDYKKMGAHCPTLLLLGGIQQRSIHFTAVPPLSSAVLLAKQISPPNEARPPS